MLCSFDSGMPVKPAKRLKINTAAAVCVTGHRENGVFNYRDDPEMREITVATVRMMLSRYIDAAMDEGYGIFINGLAMGTDLWAADYICKKKNTPPYPQLIGVMPFLKHSQNFTGYYKRVLRHAEENADILATTNSDPDMVYGHSVIPGVCSPDLYKKRNYFMVDSSSAVIAFYNSSLNRSGTAQTVNYAKRCGKRVYGFDMDDVFEVMDSVPLTIPALQDHIKSIEIKEI